MVAENRYGSNEQMIAENETYFEGFVKSVYNKSIEALEKCCNEGDCVNEYTLAKDYVLDLFSGTHLPA